MKFTISIFIIFTALCVSAKVPVYIMAGQSNMDGRAPIVEMPAIVREWREIGGTDKVLMSYCNGVERTKIGEFERYVPTCDRDSMNYCGFDAVLYSMLSEGKNTPIYIIKESKGGTAIDTLCKSTRKFYWYADSLWTATHKKKSLTHQLETNIDACIDGPLSTIKEGYEIKCIIWHQGESDRERADAYHDNLKQLVNRLRCHIAKKTGDDSYLTLPFIAGSVSSQSRQYNQVVEQSKRRLEDEDSSFYVVNLDNCKLRADDRLHFNGAGCQEAARLIYEKMKSIGVID